MGHPTKITTCCYCGARAALVLRGKERHELSCSTCGAPLHNLKRLAAAPEGRSARPPSSKKSKSKSAKHDRRPTGPVPAEISGVSHQPAPKSFHKPKQKRRKRKSMLRWAISEIGDVIEDIFD